MSFPSLINKSIRILPKKKYTYSTWFRMINYRQSNGSPFM